MKQKLPFLRTLSVLMFCFLWGTLAAHAEKRPWVKVENGTMTFLYGEKGTLAENEYDLNEGSDSPAWKDKNREITKVVFDASFKDARPTSCNDWFDNFRYLTVIEGLTNLNTSEVTTMRSMFDRCSLLQSLDLSNFDTRKVTDMFNMFGGCDCIASLDVSSFDTQNVTNMAYMFDAGNIQKIFVSDKFTTDKVTDSNHMFMVCYLLSGAVGYSYDRGLYTEGKTLANTQNGFFTDVKQKDEAKYYWVKFDNGTLTFHYGKKTTLADDESYMKGIVPLSPANPSFADDVVTAVIDASFKDARPSFCHKWFSYDNLTEIKGLENLNTSEMTDMNSMFNDCKSLRSLDLSHFDTSKVTSMVSMFCNCFALQTLNLSSFDTSNVTDMSNMFNTCLSLPSVDISNFNTSKVEDTSCMFFQCFSLRKIFVGDGVKMDKVTDSRGMFESSFSLEGAIEYDGDKTGAECANTATGYFTDVKQKPETKFGWTRHDGNTLTYYYGKKEGLDADERYVTAGYVSQEPWMKNITNVVFDKSFEEARPVSCGQWFMGYSNLTDIEGWEYLNTDRLTDMDDMFTCCEKLESVDLTNFNSAKVQMMNNTFSNCTNLKRIYVSGKFSTDNVLEGESEGIFDGCPAAIYCRPADYGTVSASDVLKDRSFRAYIDADPTAGYGTICVPQGSDLTAGTYEGFDKLYSVSKIDAAGGCVLLKEEAQLQPGVAYVYRRNITTDNAKAEISYEPNASAAAEPVADALLKGTFDGTAASAGSYVLQNDRLFHLVSADGTVAVGANQAYLQAEAGATLPNTLSLKTDGTSGITEIIGTVDTAAQHAVFDLMGRQVNAPVKGRVYVMNGKKIRL